MIWARLVRRMLGAKAAGRGKEGGGVRWKKGRTRSEVSTLAILGPRPVRSIRGAGGAFGQFNPRRCGRVYAPGPRPGQFFRLSLGSKVEGRLTGDKGPWIICGRDKYD
jgi:hypothetical protein